MRIQRVNRIYSAWAYRKNERDLDRRSQSGWRLTRPGLLRYTFERDQAVFRYRLDYCPALLSEKEYVRRRSLCEEQGWRLVGANGSGWTYWEKPLDPSLPEEAYVLPCRRTPEQEKLVGLVSLFFWLRLVLLAAGLVLAASALGAGRRMVGAALIYLACMLVLFSRMRVIQEKLK